MKEMVLNYNSRGLKKNKKDYSEVNFEQSCVSLRYEEISGHMPRGYWMALVGSGGLILGVRIHDGRHRPQKCYSFSEPKFPDL